MRWKRKTRYSALLFSLIFMTGVPFVLFAIPAADPPSCISHQRTAEEKQQLESLEQSISQDNKNPKRYYNLGVLYAQGDDGEKAQAAFQKALTHHPSAELSAKIHYNLGRVYACQQHYQEAISHFKTVIRQTPHDEDAKYNLALAQKKAAEQKQQSEKSEASKKDSSPNPSKSSDSQNSEKKESESQTPSKPNPSPNQDLAKNQNNPAETNPSTKNKASTPTPSKTETQQQNYPQPNKASSENKASETAPTVTKNTKTDPTATSTPTVTKNTKTDLTATSTATAVGGIISKEQAEQLLRIVPENRKAFIERWIQRQGHTWSPSKEQW